MNILITGGSSGLGRCVVEKCAANPLNTVYFTYNSKKDAANELSRKYQNVRAIKLDFCDLSTIADFVETVNTMDLDALINNAYVGSPNGTYFHKTPIEDFQTSFYHNLLPTIQVTQACIGTFRKKKGGCIINVLTSYLMDLPPMGFSVYSANKAYLSQLSKCWCKENLKFGIVVNSVMPDYMQTDFAEVDERIIEQMRHDHPLKELLRPEDVADIILSLLTASKQLNGVVIPITASQHINY